MLAMCNAGVKYFLLMQVVKWLCVSAMEESNVILGDIDELDIIFMMLNELIRFVL